jgi:hypothetical protein
MYKSPRAVMPPEYDTNLYYTVQDTVTNAAAFLASIRFSTEAFDVDPTLGSTAMPGFTEMAGFYARFRTLGMGYKFSCANQEAFSVTLLHGFSTTSVASGALVHTYSGNPLFGSSIVGPLTGFNTKTFRDFKSCGAISGTNQYLFDDLYTGSTASATLASAGTNYCYLGVVSTAPLTGAGVLVNVEIRLNLRFYRPKLLLS